MCTAYARSIVVSAGSACNNCIWHSTSRRQSLRPLSQSVTCLSAGDGSTKRPKEYFGSDGRRKSTIEEAFTPTGDSGVDDPATQGRPPPWAIGWQISERNLEWNDDIKLRLLTRTTATKMAISEEVLAQRLVDLSQLLPNLVSKMAIMGPDNIAKLAADPSSVALKLVQLKSIFPEADTSRMVAHKMGLILHDNLDDVAAAADELRAILKNVNVDKLVEDNPEVLNIAAFKKTLQHAKEVMGPHVDVIDTLKRRPDMIFQFQQGKDLIPYDEVPTQH